ncbi:hypothetical protein [Microbacterium sp. 77mftsu3.1]|uniref:hypothetical protein n=1 Tax=Microbacterium sp. 77mftsu3.1 TaxID=1761802 RepID=UPI00035C67FC|nr:hypothetical protein [Microbacterium sp. 77mftsu3.1]SDH37649.1 hypothetical protein SAMN04488590_3173 [Microbacterium sp. 77mftsu3.1]
MTTNDATAAVPQRQKRFTKRAWIALAAGIGAIVVGGSLSAPGIVADTAREQAGEKLAVAEKALSAAHEDYLTDRQAETDARVNAVNVYWDLRDFASKTSDKKLAASIAEALPDLATAADLDIKGDDVSVTERPVLELPEVPKTITIEVVPELTKTYEAAAKKHVEASAEAKRIAEDITAELDALEPLLTQLPSQN